MWVVMLWSASEFSGVAPRRGNGDDHPVRLRRIELNVMEHAVDPSRCATNVPQDHCSGAVQANHEGGPKPLTCADTAWRHRAGTDDLRIHNEQAACPLTMCHKMCHMARLEDVSVGHESRR